MILAGDIGGTRSRLAIYEDAGKKPVRHQVLESGAFPSLEAVLREFLGTKPPKLRAASIGVAGPVIDQRVVATNLPWVIDGRKIAKLLGTPKVTLLNDLVALGFGALTVPPKRMRVLQNGIPKAKGGNLAILAAGTGLGEAALVWDGARHLPLATEGGHTDFAARDELEIDLLKFLQHRVGGRVSYERILAGPGFSALYDFFKDARGMKETRANEDRLREAGDRNAEISRLGVTGESKVASVAVDLFARIYGAEAGNLALKTFATAGVFVAGGIAGHLEPILTKGPFLEAFLAKGRFRALLEKVPVAIVLDPDIGLAGSRYHAASSKG